MNGSYEASLLPLRTGVIDQTYFLDELIDATAKLEVYKEKILDSKLDSSWFMPTLQQKEALASSSMDGTQATLDGVLINQVVPDNKNKNLNEVQNYYYKGEWNEWIKFFLATVAKQCDKYIGIISQINNLYEKHLKIATDLARSLNIVSVINALYQYPVASGKQIADVAKAPPDRRQQIPVHAGR